MSEERPRIVAMSEIKDRARQLLEARLEALAPLEEAANRAERAREELRAAESSIGTAWSRATDAGWTPAELKRLGLRPPTVQRKVSRKRSASREARGAAAAASHESSHQEQE
jgi:hypothetical protein